MKKFLIIFVFILSARSAAAAIFPNDAKTVSFDSINNTTCTSSASVLLAATTTDRTLLKAQIDARTSGDFHIGIGNSSTTYPRNLILDSEAGQESDVFMSWKLKAGEFVYCDKSFAALNNHVWFQLVYTDYDLSLITDTETGSTTTYPAAPTTTTATTTPNTAGIFWALLFFVSGLIKQFWPYILVIGIVFGFAVSLAKIFNKLKKV